METVALEIENKAQEKLFLDFIHSSKIKYKITQHKKANTHTIPKENIPSSEYLEILNMNKEKKNVKKELRFDWEGGLADIKENYNSVDLQHKVKEWIKNT